MKTSGKLKHLKQNCNSILAVHYSCQKLADGNENYSPRITSIAVLNLESAAMHSFSLHLEAEVLKIPIDDIESHYDELEKAMLIGFYKFASDNNNALWLHWNMSNINFGFEALVHRHRVLTGDFPGRLENSKKYNLSDLIAGTYGNNYVDHPRMPNLMKYNGGAHRDILTGTEEVEAFTAKEYVKLHNSTMAKVYWFKKIFNKLLNKKLKTQRNNIGQKINSFLQKPQIQLLSFIAVIFTLTQLTLLGVGSEWTKGVYNKFSNFSVVAETTIEKE